ncbi:xaa-Pro aminopeptidase-like protein [Dipodascopsis tothii]|uniref:xaa-Pro aminopeptidase-like protein n=1 Tax=Dipodascopsis tothii TaxID=44089 RepID=UPI0034CE6832
MAGFVSACVRHAQRTGRLAGRIGRPAGPPGRRLCGLASLAGRPRPAPAPASAPPTGAGAARAYTGVARDRVRGHRLRDGERKCAPDPLTAVTPGISAEEYYFRRSLLSSKLPIGSVAICVGAEIKFRKGSAAFYGFNQDPDFFYLTGLNEPTAVFALERHSETEYTTHAYLRPKNHREEIWEGPRLGLEIVDEMFNFDTVKDIKFAAHEVAEMAKRATTVYFDMPKPRSEFASVFLSEPPATEARLVAAIRDARKGRSVRALRPVVDEMRTIKSAFELEVMREVGAISGAVFNKAYATEFDHEADLDAFLDYHFRTGGCENSAYIPVVGGGENGLFIHYTVNNNPLRDGDLVLVDAGGQLGGYCADISRTWPVNGRFSGPQRDLYQAVLNVQKECLKLCTVDSGLSLNDIHRRSESLLAVELRNIGFDASRKQIAAVLYPHAVGHYLGLDVHDSPSVSKERPLRHGQVVTIEPGVYVPYDDAFPRHFQGIGIRIEDDVFVDEASPIVLSSSALKEVDEIEELCRERV